MSAAWCASCVEGRGGCFCGGVFCESEPLVCVFVCFFFVNSLAHHDGVAARVGALCPPPPQQTQRERETFTQTPSSPSWRGSAGGPCAFPPRTPPTAPNTHPPTDINTHIYKYVCVYNPPPPTYHDGVAARVGLVLGHLSGRLAADVAAVLRARLFWKEK